LHNCRGTAWYIDVYFLDIRQRNNKKRTEISFKEIYLDFIALTTLNIFVIVKSSYLSTERDGRMGKKVLLTNPPKTGSRQEDMRSYPNMGILSLIAYARQRMPDVQFIHMESEVPGSYLAKIREIEPDLIGMSFATCMEKLAYTEINKIKEAYPEIPLICGGPHPTALPEEAIQNCKVDVCAVGEGEATFTELLEHYLYGSKSLKEIDGLVFRDGEEIVYTKKRAFLNIDSVPMPAWDIVDFKDYLGAHLMKNYPSTCMVTNRGCPFNCTFCSNPVWKSNKPWLRTRSSELISEEVKYLYNRGIREIYIRADELNANYKWCIEVCQAIASLGFRDLTFQCNLRAEKITEELAEALQSINCWMIYLGIESMNQRVINGIQKHIKIEEIPQYCRILHAHRIKVYGFMMLYQAWEENGELAFETPEEVDSTLRETNKLINQGLLDYLSWQFATPFPASQLWDVAHKYKIIREDLEGVWNVSLNLPGVCESKMIRQQTLGFILQVKCALKTGHLNLKMWRRFLNKILYIMESFPKFLQK
jgi:radical SAM superfamily enzyme YgiQ (UPF0313 family)